MTVRPQSEEIKPAAPLSKKGFGKLPFILFCLLSAVLIAVYAVAISPIRVGDAHEYLLMVQAWSAHGSPDIRPADLDSYIELLQRNDLLPRGPLEKTHYIRNSYTTDAGAVHFGHFWFYSLLAVPASLLFRFTGGNEMATLQLMNAAYFCLAAGVVLFHGREKWRDRLLLLAFSAIGPVIWYIRWPHPEVYTWAMVLIAVVLLRQNRFCWAAIAASLGALQNPPLFLLVLLAIALAAGHRNWRATALTATGAALSFLPALYYQALFGVPNLIMSAGCTDVSLISPGRMWSVLADLNQGMLPFVPLVLLLGLLGGGMALARGRFTGILVLAVLLGMILLVGMQRNWNAGASGMMRYAVWMIPLLAWLAVDFVPRRRWLVWLIAAGLLLQLGIVLNHDGREDYLRQSALARFVLTHGPRLYSPDPQIFSDRQLGREVNSWTGHLPIPVVTESGDVTKILVDQYTHQHLSDYFMIEQDSAWVEEQEAGRPKGLYYLHPPRHGLRVVDPEGMNPVVFKKQLRIRLIEVPESLSEAEFEITVEVSNEGPYSYWGQRACAPHPLKLGYLVHRKGERICSGRTPMPFLMKPGAITVRKMRIELPQSSGRYRLTIGTLIENLVWSDSTAHLTVDCFQAEWEQYRGTVAVSTEDF